MEADLMVLRNESSSDAVKRSEGEEIPGLAVGELLRYLGDAGLADECGKGVKSEFGVEGIDCFLGEIDFER